MKTNSRSNPHVARILNVGLRGTTLVSKFLLIFLLARFLEPAELGLYGLLVATIGYALYFLGLEFYAFSTRELLRNERAEWGRLLKTQGIFTLSSYGASVPLFLLAFAAGVLPWKLAGWFFALLVTEHVAQELNRLLVAISDQVFASIVLFFRSGAWAVGIAALMYVDEDARQLSWVFTAWLAGGAMACSLGGWRLSRLNLGGWSRQTDWRWVKAGLLVAAPFLFSSLALRAIFTIDRYWVSLLAGLDVLGAYVLFVGMANALIAFLDAGVFSFSYPGLISSYQQNNPCEFRRGMRALLLQTIAVSVVFSVVAVAVAAPMLSWLGKQLYIEKQHLFPWILLAVFLYAASMIPHYALYAQGKDRAIVLTHIAALVVFVAMAWVLSFRYTELAVPLALCCAFATMLLWKSYVFFQVTPVEYRNSGAAN